MQSRLQHFRHPPERVFSAPISSVSHDKITAAEDLLFADRESFTDWLPDRRRTVGQTGTQTTTV